jgi:hypothetical protein
MSTELQFEQLPPHLMKLITRVTRELAQEGYAFGAIYIVKASTHQAMFLLREHMPQNIRLQLLDDIAKDAVSVREVYKSQH